MSHIRRTTRRERRSSLVRISRRRNRPCRKPRRRSAERPGSPHRVPRDSRVQQLAFRAAFVADLRRSSRPVAPHDRPLPHRARCAETPERCRREQLRQLPRGQCQTVHRREQRRLPDRRRDPVLSRRGVLRSGRAPDGHRLGAVPPRDGRLRCHLRARRQLDRPCRRPQALPLRAARSQRPRPDGKGHRRARAADEVLPHGQLHDRRTHGPLAPARHGRAAGVRAVRPVGRRRARALGADRGG